MLLTEFPELEIENILIRIPRFADASKILDFYVQNEEFLAPFDPPKPENFHTLEFSKEIVQNYQNNWVARTQLRFILICKSSLKMAGMISFTGMERGPFQSCRLGYKLGERFTGKGIMTNSLKNSIEYLFNELNFHRIEASYLRENAPSRKVLERSGFVTEGIAKDYLFINGKWRDHTLTSLINKNWKDFSS